MQNCVYLFSFPNASKTFFSFFRLIYLFIDLRIHCFMIRLGSFYFVTLNKFKNVAPKQFVFILNSGCCDKFFLQPLFTIKITIELSTPTINGKLLQYREQVVRKNSKTNQPTTHHIFVTNHCRTCPLPFAMGDFYIW